MEPDQWSALLTLIEQGVNRIADAIAENQFPDGANVAKAINTAFFSPSVADRNLESANLVDTTDRMCDCIRFLAETVREVAVALREKREGH
jgi:hypothetical protein